MEAICLVLDGSFSLLSVFNFFFGVVLQNGRRSDGRTLEEIRPINSRCGLLPRAHGSGLFTRGETQVCWSIILVYTSYYRQIEFFLAPMHGFPLQESNFFPIQTFFFIFIFYNMIFVVLE